MFIGAYIIIKEAKEVMKILTSNYKPRRGLDLLDAFFNDWSDDFGPKSRIVKTKAGHEVHLVVPGVSKDEVSVDIENNLITVSYDQKEDGGVFAINSFSKSWKLPTTANIDDITASSENGILTINVPNKEEPKSEKKKIKIV